MIRINLLPVQADRQRQSSKQQLIIALLLLLVEVAALYYVYSRQQTALTDQRRQVADLEAEVNRLQQQSQEVDRLNAQKDQLVSFATVLEDLEANRAGPVQVMDELKMMLNRPMNELHQVRLQQMGWDTNWNPRNVWLRSFREVDGAVSVSGHARAIDDIAEFNVRLASSPYFSGVRLERTSTEQVDGQGRVVRFELTASVNYSLVGEGS
jgi:type IV pilus assembly protein PilN